MIRVVVTGGAGFIGSNLIEYLFKCYEEIEIVSIDNLSSGSTNNHLHPSLIGQKITYLIDDVKNISTILNNLGHFDAVFHFAEFSRIVQSFEYYSMCFETNLKSTFEVVKYCCTNGIKLIYSASSSRFGNNGKDEHLSPYSWTKAKNIELIKNFRSWFGLEYEITYFYNVYGPKQLKNHYMSAVIGLFEQKYCEGRPITVVTPGTQTRDFTHVNDIVRGVELAYRANLNNEFLLGTGANHAIIDVAKMFDCPIEMIPERRGERLASVMLDNKAERLLGYVPEYSLADYIEEFKRKHNYGEASLD